MPASLLIVALTAGVPFAARADLGDDIGRAERQLQLLESKVGLIRHEYLQYAEDKASASMRFEKRLNDGQALMLLKDYVRAAIVFYDLVERDIYRDHPGYADALFSLGEALFFNRNFIDARKYFLQLLDDRRARPYRKVAMVRLMQIALRTNAYERVDEIHARLVRETSSASPQGEYLWGKTLYQRGKLEEAARAFSKLRPGEPFYFQARYFLGVVFIRQERLEDALNIYAALVDEKPRNEQEKQVRELAHIARGRLLHDLGREAEALDAYQAIEHTSPQFDQALFEICWTYIQRAEKAEAPQQRNRWLLEAKRTIEILEVSTPDSTLVPRAHLLKGHILEKMGEFEQAAEAFIKVSNTYAAVKEELDSLMAEHDDPVRYFNEVAGKNLDSFDLSAYLPPLAVKWMSSQDEMAAALGVMKDIGTGRRFVSEARALLAKLDALLDEAKDRINLFPVLREGAKRALEVENARVLLERNLARLEERIVIEHVSADERRAMEVARRKRERLEKRIEQLPRTKQESDSREARIRERIESLERAVYESGIALKGMKAQLRAMEEWIHANEDKLRGKEEAVLDFREEIRRGWATANQLQSELDTLANTLGTEKARAGLDSQTLTKEEKLRQLYEQALQRERELAEQIHSRLGAEGTAHITRINALRLRTDKLRRQLAEINRELEHRVLEKSKELKQKAQAEAERLAAFEQSLASLERESENLAGEVAFRALEEVRQRFYRLVLDADVGVLDVAWSRKQQKTRKITELSRKQAADQRRLREEFKSVLEEVN